MNNALTDGAVISIIRLQSSYFESSVFSVFTVFSSLTIRRRNPASFLPYYLEQRNPQNGRQVRIVRIEITSMSFERTQVLEARPSVHVVFWLRASICGDHFELEAEHAKAS
jgi:hypothetical protein